MPTTIHTVIKACGTPTFNLVGKALQEAIDENRVLTVYSKAAQGRKVKPGVRSYYGKPGYNPENSEYLLAFPCPLRQTQAWEEIRGISRACANHGQYLEDLKKQVSAAVEKTPLKKAAKSTARKLVTSGASKKRSMKSSINSPGEAETEPLAKKSKDTRLLNKAQKKLQEAQNKSRMEFEHTLQKKRQMLHKQLLSAKVHIDIGGEVLCKHVILEISTKKKPQLKMAKKVILSRQEVEFLGKFI
ncbi:MAG: hypothetical protein AAF984_01270 [Verrucomicrobiota bacterium]